MPYREVARAFLVRVFFDLALRLEQAQEPQEGEHITYKDGRKYINARRSQNAPKRERHPTEAEQRTHERRNWTTQNSLSGLTILLTIVVGIFAWLTYKATRDQANAAVEGNFENSRAWIRVDDFAHPSLSILPYGAFFNTAVKVTNIGHSPAQRIYAVADLISGQDKADPISRALGLCRPGIQNEVPQFEPMVFPDQPGSVSANAQVSIHAIESLPASRTRLSSFVVVGCITYYMPTGQMPGHTTFVYDLNRSCNLDPRFPKCSFDLRTQAIYFKPDLLLERSLGGDRAD